MSRHEVDPGPPVVTADILVQRMLPVGHVVLTQVLVLAGLTAAEALRLQGWQGGAMGLAVAAAIVARVRGGTLPKWLALWLKFACDRRKRLRDNGTASDIAEPFDADGGDGEKVGFRWDGETLLSMLRIEANPQAITILEPGVTVSGETVPVQLVADCLRQYDVSLASVDVISHGARSHGGSRIAAVYDAVLGPLPAIAERTVWIVVRFDPSRCANAVRRRGGGRDGILRAAATATRRVASRLVEAGLRPRILTSVEIGHAVNQLSDGLGLRNVTENWATCSAGRFQLRSYLLPPALLTTEGLAGLWTVPSYSTTLTVSLRPDDAGDAVQIRGLARFDTRGSRDVALGDLDPLVGQQFSALTASLPLPPPNHPVQRWAFGRGDSPFANLALPAAGCGQVIGADADGRAVAVPLFGRHVARVEISGTLHLAQQVVLRSLALGARVRVHTERPAQWHAMVERVGDQDMLWVDELRRGAIQAGSERNLSMEIFDGVAEQAIRVGVTVVVVQPPAVPPSDTCDVALQLLDPRRDTVRVSTHAGSSVVTMVATDDELDYLQASLAATEFGAPANRAGRPAPTSVSRTRVSTGAHHQ
ncbi:type VII secretion protein EccE [Mycolicibacterium arenosum]|uniref:Type VII secretion protein EccE n=1 Tax=Mycolicibacterium arenosum TaxID=2952157 RepID=A0ABT1LXF2_9MYCO|nr:type VII secretion protein EccE [Mycolicibacterium sp. CAU 1645]MCP9271570.1 type VII secretion protein EccE [Mycolicibacterium sp. CAU 1645]